MKSFNEIYTKMCSREYSEINDSVRKRNLKTGICIAVMVVVGVIAFALPVYIEYSYAILGVNIMVGIAFLAIINRGSKRLNRLYKQDVVMYLLNEMFKNPEYMPDSGVPESVFNSRLFGDKYDIYINKELIKLPYNNCIFSQVCTKTENRDSDGNRTYTTQFLGLAGRCKLNKTIPEEILVKENSSFCISKKRVKVDMSEFEKYFDVVSNEKILAMRILTADVMSSMVKMRKQINVPYQLGMQNNYLYFRISCGNMFDINLNKKATDEKTIQKYYNILFCINEISTNIRQLLDEMEI